MKRLKKDSLTIINHHYSPGCTVVGQGIGTNYGTGTNQVFRSDSPIDLLTLIEELCKIYDKTKKLHEELEIQRLINISIEQRRRIKLIKQIYKFNNHLGKTSQIQLEFSY